MSIIDLTSRCTSDWEKFNSFLKSNESYIFIEGKEIIKNDDPAALDLKVGSRWYNNKDNKFYAIPKDGLNIQPKHSVIVETEQRLALPFNIFGLVTGKGRYIFRGIFISSGKVDPGFNGKLKIGLFNGSNNRIIVKHKSIFCTVVFFEMESTIDMPLRNYESSPELKVSGALKTRRFVNWFRTNWYYAITILVSLVALIIALIK